MLCYECYHLMERYRNWSPLCPLCLLCRRGKHTAKSTLGVSRHCLRRQYTGDHDLHPADHEGEFRPLYKPHCA